MRGTRIVALCSANGTMGVYMLRKLRMHKFDIAGGKDIRTSNNITVGNDKLANEKTFNI